tara:strand:+ start:29374 stop:31338 length:1965 start_codon:yes stop_codon:yes gene_type:complete
MCGIVGFINKEYKLNSNKNNIVTMTKKLSHRGPDYYNTWHDNKNCIYFGHTRLSILDLSSNGNQPMLSYDNNLVIIFNGEIYNHLEIRKLLSNYLPENFNWKSESDTETLVNSISIFGLEKTLDKIHGMFAFALYDIKKKLLYLVRDRSGEKPLYYGFADKTFVFGSELKAIRAYSNFNNPLDEKSLNKYFMFSYIPSPNTIYKNIYKLKKGSFLKINIEENININPSLHLITNEWAKKDEYFLNDDLPKNNNYTNELHYILKTAVKRQLITDVPIGAFLSGGIDSSLIVSIMQELNSSPIDTFTIGFENQKFDESEYAKKISEILQTNHNEMFVSYNDLIAQVPLMHQIYDEPFADSSQIPTFLLSKFARSKVKVSLSGDGGDELFGGYNRYLWGERVWFWVSLLPNPMTKMLSKFLLLFSDNFLQKIEKPLNKIFLKELSINNLPEKVKKLHSKINSAKNFNQFYLNLVTEWENINEILVNIKMLDDTDYFNIDDIKIDNKTNKMMYWDYNTYLSDDILCKLDRAAMSNSLETRVPFLDKQVIEFAFNLPIKYKINKNKTKWILREILKNYLPDNLINRPKMGFSIPLADWLRGPLKKWAQDLIFDGVLTNNDIFVTNRIEMLWKNHLSHREDNSVKLWQLLIFSSWHNNNI